MRIVVDTNIWVSGLLWRGLPWMLLKLAEAHRMEICTTPAIMAELNEVLSYHRLQPRVSQLRVSPTDLVGRAILLATLFGEQADQGTIVAADPDDDHFVRCAIASKASYIVSGDHHLLDLKEYSGIPIVSVRDFMLKEFPDFVE